MIELVVTLEDIMQTFVLVDTKDDNNLVPPYPNELLN